MPDHTLKYAISGYRINIAVANAHFINTFYCQKIFSFCEVQNFMAKSYKRFERYLVSLSALKTQHVQENYKITCLRVYSFIHQSRSNYICHSQ